MSDRRPPAPYLVRLPHQFGTVWLNPHRIDCINIAHGGRTSTVTIRAREQRISTLDTVKLTPGDAAALVAEIFTLIRADKADQ